MTLPASSLTVLRLLAIAAALGLGSLAQAQVQFQVQLDTHALVSDPAGPYSLDFQLNDGSGLGDGNNWASISNFSFVGGGAEGQGTSFGGVSGDLASSVTLRDSHVLINEFYQGFAAGSSLSFTVSLTTNLDGGPTPDRFSFSILDHSLSNIATRSLGTDAFLEVNLNQENPTISVYGSSDRRLAAPTVVPVPETSTYGLCGAAALLGLISLRRRRKS